MKTGYPKIGLGSCTQNSILGTTTEADFRVPCFRKKVFEITMLLPEIPRARSPTGVATRRATRPRPRALRGIPRMAGPGLGVGPQGPPGALWGPGIDFCGPEDHLEQLQSPGRREEAIRKNPVL